MRDCEALFDSKFYHNNFAAYISITTVKKEIYISVPVEFSVNTKFVELPRKLPMYLYMFSEKCNLVKCKYAN